MSKVKRKTAPILDPKVDDLCALMASILARSLKDGSNPETPKRSKKEEAALDESASTDRSDS